LIEPEYISINEVMFILGRKRSTIFRMIKDEEFPKPISFGMKKPTHWNLKEIRAWARKVTKVFQERVGRHPERMSHDYPPEHKIEDIDHRVAFLVKI